LSVNTNGTNGGASRVGTLSIATQVGSSARLDLRDNDLIVQNSTYGAVAGLISGARSGGAWTGLGLTSSTAAAATPKNKTLGTLTGADYHAAAGAAAQFDGFTVADSEILVKFTYYGDTDFTGLVDFDDYSRTDAGFNNHRNGWFNGDFDYNGIVDFDDYSLIDQAFNTQSGTLRRAMSYLEGGDRSTNGMDSPALQMVVEHFDRFGLPYAQSFLNAVPEPASALTICGMSILMAGRRRRQRRA